MNGSSLFGGESFATVYDDGAVYNISQISGLGVVINATDEKGVFAIQDTSSGANDLEITIDGKIITASTGELSVVIGGGAGGGPSLVKGLIYKSSLKVEVKTYTSGTVTVHRFS